MANIALLPGGFKPPHAGHYAVAKYLSQKSGAEILVRVGAKKRDDITQAMSIKIWGIYGVEAEPAASDSPIADVFKYVEEKATEEDTIYVGTGEKDYPRFKVLTDPSFKPDNYKKYNPKGVKVIEISIPPQAGGVSGTKMREFIMNDQKDLFQKYLPDHIDKDKIWNIVLDNIQEDLYNPNDHVLDYMKSSEFKAGYTKKDDVPPGYKYRRGGQYSAASGQGGAGSMYEDAQYETGKVLHVYDFDDTIAQVKANIKTTITSPSDPNFLQKLDIASTEFPEESKELEARLGSLEIKYDFSEFEKQIGDAIVNSKVVSKLKDSLSRPDIKTTILTARSIGHPVTRYLKRDLGLDAYVVPLGLQVDGKVTGQDKANWIEKHINKGYQTIYFIDDSEENRTAVLALKDKYPDIRLKVEDPAAVREMRGTMNNQEKAKHSKNLKRLSKDLKKQGDQYMEVPDYLKGTLKRKMYEKVTEDSVICDNCGWTWKIVDGGSDLYICHKCNHDNTPINENFPPYKADQVQKVRYQASDTFTNSPKQAKKRGYLEKKDPKKGTGKKPKGSGRRLYTDENPSDTVKVKFSTRQDIVDTLNKASFKNKPHKRQSQIINLIHQRVRAALNRAKDPEVKKRLKPAFEYIKKRKETSKNKTQRMRKESSLTKSWWKEQLTEILTETKANTHLTHLEELILTQGQDGFNQAKSFLYELIKNLKGEDNSIKNVSVKWDGAPAIFTGINPENGKFFVGTKSVFNVNPKINYTSQDIDKNHGHAAGLAKKLKLALQYLPAVGIKGILQGDFMFDSDDVKTDDIDGISHYTFKPNTIRYAVEANSKIGKEILNAKIGIIFHTTYSDLSGGGASFGADTSGLNESNNVWFDNAYFKDDTGILLNEKEEAFVLEKIKEADSINVNYDALPDEISSRAKTNLLNTYLNQEIRKGEFITDPNKSFETFVNWYKGKIETAVAKISPKNQDKKREVLINKLKAFIKAKDIVLNLFKVSKLLSEAKNIFIAKYDKAVATKHFIDNGDGTLRVTKAEGFVAVDHTESGIKLVDRLEFSKNNFNAGKPGAKK
tara:strand:+ start:417 stop:3602 length:3186 start_codon:yes stop_codon:yes gene_type:complete